MKERANFCDSCRNLLVPKEDKANKKLIYVCKHCEMIKEADSPLVYSNELIVKDGAAVALNAFIALDPTLPRTYDYTCTKCRNNECVYFRDPSKGEESMYLVFVCCTPSCKARLVDIPIGMSL